MTQETAIMTQYDIDLWQIDLSIDKKQLRNLSDVTLSIVFSNHFWSFWVDFPTKFTEDDLDLN